MNQNRRLVLSNLLAVLLWQPLHLEWMYGTVAEGTDEKRREWDWCIGRQRWIDMMRAYSFGSRVRSDRESSRQRSMDHVRSSRWMLAACASISWPWQTMAGDRARAWATGVHTVVCHSIVIFFFFEISLDRYQQCRTRTTSGPPKIRACRRARCTA